MNGSVHAFLTREPVLGEIMTSPVVTVGMDDTVGAARELFREARFHHLPVVEGGRLVGIVSDRDILRAISPYLSTQSEREQDAATLRRKIHQIMKHHVVTASKGDPIVVGAALLVDHAISCLPLLSPDGRIEGIVATKDFLRWLVRQPLQPVAASVVSQD